MELTEYKLKWLAKQLKQFNEQESRFFDNYDVMSAAALDRYLKSRSDLAEEPLVIFLKEFAEKRIQIYEDCIGSIKLLFDASTHRAIDFAPCVTWCIDMLQAYDKWKNRSENG